MNTYTVEYDWKRKRATGKSSYTLRARSPELAIKQARHAFARDFEPIGYTATCFSISSGNELLAVLPALKP